MANHRKTYLEITSICNLSCSFCPKTTRKPRSLSREEFLWILPKLRLWGPYLYFHLMGEPLIHPDLSFFLTEAKKAGFLPMITTNGTLLPQKEELLLHPQAAPHKISISLHSFESNLCADMSLEGYIESVIDFAKKASDRGVIVVLRLWNLDGRSGDGRHEENDNILSLLHSRFPGDWVTTRSGYRIRHCLFLEWGDKFDWPSFDAPKHGENGFCYALRDQIGILSDGTVVPCCLDHNGDLALGNLFTEDLDTILSSDRAKAIYDAFTSHRCAETLCQHCMRAEYYRNAKHSKNPNT
ncbi:MAG: radical SAM protein [Clostridia bacterium]|nr:radical SAM protein [Clostridia bacterium]